MSFIWGNTMKTKEIKNIPGLKDDQVVTIWKMNYGFRSDLQGQIAKVNLNSNGKKEVSVDLTIPRIFYLVYGILEAPALGIEKPLSIELGLNESELTKRISIIRNMESDVAEYIYPLVQEINNPEENTEDIKKELPEQ